MIESVSEFFHRHRLGGTGIIALSGGPDSVCLALALRRLVERGIASKVVLAHLNHKLRGPTGDADQAFVLALAKEWQLPCRTATIDVAAKAKEDGANLEATARRLRYEWLTEVARAEGAAWVATGHSADDQAETVLFRMLRGSGLHGLAGMPERRPLTEGIDLVRPLLQIRRNVILDFLARERQNYCRDETNDDPRFTRNRIRHELMPLLAEKYNPAITDLLCGLAAQAEKAQGEISGIARSLLAEAELPRAGDMVVLDTGVLKTAVPHLRCEVFRLIWRREIWPMGDMDAEAWDRLSRLVEQEKGALDLPDGVQAQRIAEVIQLKRSTVPKVPLKKSWHNTQK